MSGTAGGGGAGAQVASSSRSKQQPRRPTYAIDPSLLDPALGGLDNTWTSAGDPDDDDDEEEEEEEESESSESSESSGDGDTDAEDEYRAEMGGVKRKKGRGSSGNMGSASRGIDTARAGANAKGKGKGKAKEDGDEAFTGFEDREELGRLIHAIRDSASTTVGGRTALDKEFDRSIEEELEGIDDPMFEARGGKGKKSKGRRAARDIEPSAEVKSLLGRANRHYANGEHDPALELLSEVIRIEPGLRAPWYTLATIQEEKGDKEKAIMFKIVATHLAGQKSSAPEWADLGGQSRDIGLLQQAIYCFSQAIRGDKNDVDSMWDRAVLLKMSGSAKQATSAFLALLNIHPHDPGVLRELAPLLASQFAYAKASSLYLSAFEYFRSKVPHVTNPEEISSFGVADLETLADFLAYQHQFSKVIEVLRTGVRWLQGREKETGWDALEDDREYDKVRKIRPGWEKEARFLEEAQVYDLDVRLRVRLGVARMGLGKIPEAQHHFNIVLEEGVAEFPELYGAVADSYFERGMFTEALEVYQDMAENEDTNGPPVWIKVAQCHHALGDLEEARDCYEAVADADPNNLDAKMELAKVYEQMNNPHRALAMINEIMDTRRRMDIASAEEDAEGHRRLGKDARPVLSREERQHVQAQRIAAEEKRHQEFTIAFQRLKGLDAAVEREEEQATVEWLEIATNLVDAFRETRELFPSDGKKKFVGVLARKWRRKGGAELDIATRAGQMASRLERRMDEREGNSLVEVDSFRGLDFDGWLKLIIRYAFLLTKNDEAEAGQETLIHVSTANVFKQSESRSLALRLARAACYIHDENYREAINAGRWIALRYQFHPDGMRLVQALVPSGAGCIEAFNGSGFQKYTIRQLRLIEDIAKGKETAFNKSGNRVVAGEEEEDEAGDEDQRGNEATRFLPTVSNPMILMTYAAMLLTSRSYQSAIIYLLRAHDLAPNQPLINLSLGIAYLHRSMSRQTDNRHHQIATGLAFLAQYRKLMGPCQEVEYNFGRAFHDLGLQSHAIKHYEAVLHLATMDRLARRSAQLGLDVDAMQVDEDEADDEDIPPEDHAKAAAYNLLSLYVLSGSPELGREVARKWLAV